jgi:hypothetical protein
LELAPNTAGELFAHYFKILNQLSQKLPERFHQTLAQVRQGLSLLFRPDYLYPIVLNHDDLPEMNIHVDEETGRITGIVDWVGAKIAPFGTSLGGLETILGVQTASSWHFHTHHGQFRMEFWKMFYEVTGNLSDDDRQAIEVERLHGLCRTHGFDRRPEEANAAPLEEGDQDLVYLEAFCLR